MSPHHISASTPAERSAIVLDLAQAIYVQGMERAVSAEQNIPWRGLASDPNGGKA